jgi:hypothetical protein
MHPEMRTLLMWGYFWLIYFTGFTVNKKKRKKKKEKKIKKKENVTTGAHMSK